MFIAQLDHEKDGRRYVKGFFKASKELYNQKYKDSPLYAYIHKTELIKLPVEKFIQNCSAFYYENGTLQIDTTKL